MAGTYDPPIYDPRDANFKTQTWMLLDKEDYDLATGTTVPALAESFAASRPIAKQMNGIHGALGFLSDIVRGSVQATALDIATTLDVDGAATFGGAATFNGQVETQGTSPVVLLGRQNVDGVNRLNRILSDHYTSAQADWAVLYTLGLASSNQILIGGGAASRNAATQISFYTAANNTTLVGTERWRVENNGNLFPLADNAYDIATASLRARAVYAYDIDAADDVTVGDTVDIGTNSGSADSARLNMRQSGTSSANYQDWYIGGTLSLREHVTTAGTYQMLRCSGGTPQPNTGIRLDQSSGDVYLGETGRPIYTRGFHQRSTAAGITASTTQTQGQQPLTADVNEISTCANVNDTVTLPSAAAGRKCIVANNGAQTLQVFPASGDDLGAGLNTATTIAAAGVAIFEAYDATNWIQTV